MSEEEIKEALRNVLMMQNNNDANFQILQAQNDRLQSQIDGLKQQLAELNDLKEMFRLPKPENKDRKLFEVVEE